MKTAEAKKNIIAAYHNRAKALFAYDVNGDLVVDKAGTPVRALNSWAAAFWAGVDGLTRGPRVPTRSMISYPFYAAGKHIRKSQEA